jgi:phosphate-selective porin OprO/OprP
MLVLAVVCSSSSAARSQSPVSSSGQSGSQARDSRSGPDQNVLILSPEAPARSLPTAPSPPVPENKPDPAAPIAAPIQGPFDLDAIKQMIRAELKAEMNKQDADARNRKPDSPSPVAAPDLEVIKQMVREELKVEKAETDMILPAQPLPAANNLRLDASVQNGFVAETADKSFRFHFGGRMDFDNAWFTQNKNLLIGTSPGTLLEDGTDFRRARLRADGQAWGFIDFVAEVNFANIQDVSNVNNSTVPIGSVGLTDFYLTFRDLPVVGNIRVGHFIAPYGLERYTTSEAWYYMERSSLYDAFLNPNDYQNGVMLFNSFLDDRITAATAFTRVGKATLDSFGFAAEDGLYAEGLRLTGLPIYEDDGRMLLHLGFNYFHQSLSGHTFTVANRMPLRAGGGSDQIPNLLDTGNFFSPNGADFFDFECAFVLGPFSISGEYALARATDVFENFNGVTFSGPRGNATYQAFYVESGIFLTPGDHRSYDKKIGTWARTVPQQNFFVGRGDDGSWCHGCGAVQLLARFTYLDLVSGSPTLTPTSGGARAGRQQDVTVGVNWYLNPQTIIACNYVWTHLDSVVAGASGDIQGVGIRVHFDF